MREMAAIVEPAFDFEQNTRAILKEHIALQDDERNADAHERKSIGFREAAARRRLEIGRMLIEQKRSKKIAHGGWLPYLEKLGINERSAREWMALAGHVETKSEPNQNGADLPTRREVNEARRQDAPTRTEQPTRPAPREEQPDLPTHAEPPRERTPEPPSIDIDRELSRIQDKLCAAAATVPRSVRTQIAHELRETARIIEEMS